MTDEEMARQIEEGRARECPHSGSPTIEDTGDCWACFFKNIGGTVEFWCHPDCEACRTCSECCFQHPEDVQSSCNVSGCACRGAVKDSGAVTFEQVAQDIYDEAFDLLVARQEKYGSRNIDQQGLYGVLVRIRDDKLSRIQRAFNGRVVAGEIVLDEIDTSGEEGDTLEDAYLDVANYAVISLMLLRGGWGYPLERDVDEGYEPYE